MSKPIRIALLQHACTSDVSQNIKTAMSMMREAASQGAQVIFTQELFTSLYFCQTQDPAHFDLAVPIPGPLTEQLCSLAKELNIHLVASLFEKRAPGLFHNTSVCIDATGTLVNRYRKMHIPDDPGFYEKFYFTPPPGSPGSFPRSQDTCLKTSGGPGSDPRSQDAFGQSPMLSPFRGAKHGISPWNQDACLKTSGETPQIRRASSAGLCLDQPVVAFSQGETSGGSGGGYQVTLLGDLKVGTLICWDQWFPEAARLTAMLGAQILTYPTAIGYWQGEPSETPAEGASQRDAWITIQRSHAIANGCYVAAINRIGNEGNLTFWGSSFVVDPGGNIIIQATEDQQQILLADIDVSQLNRTRQMWPFFRDRRIDSYGDLLKRWGDD